MDGSVFYRLVRWTSIPLFRLYFPLSASGRQHVPAEGPLIVAANHASYLDPAVLGSACPRPLHFLINRRVWRVPAMNWFYRGMESIPVDPAGAGARASIQAALVRLQAAAAVGIFPEGARAEGGELQDALDGVALLSRRSGAPVVPVGIAGTAESMPKGASLPEPLPVRVAFGPPMRRADSGGGPRARREEDREFTDELMRRIAELVEEAEAGRRPAAALGRAS
jgi:1-acyl-sn-glycerol-3-phosphate acyltransferase